MSTQSRRKIFGALGELLAQQYLITEGYELEAKNWRGERGELDLIVRQDDLLVIVEVRSMSSSWLDRPAEATSPKKQKQVARCADEYLSKRPQTLAQIIHIRFDVIGLIIPNNDCSTSSIQLDHVENAYSSPWAF